MEVTMTKTAKYILRELYNSYTRRIRSGVDYETATLFGECEKIQEILGNTISTTEIASAVFELGELGFIAYAIGDCEIIFSQITSSGIAYMECSPNRKLKSFLSAVGTIAGFFNS